MICTMMRLAESCLFGERRFNLEGYFRGFNARLTNTWDLKASNYFAVASQGLKQNLLDRKRLY